METLHIIISVLGFGSFAAVLAFMLCLASSKHRQLPVARHMVNRSKTDRRVNHYRRDDDLYWIANIERRINE